MSVTCQILINKPKEGAHRPGNLVTGIVKYEIDKPTEYQDVILSFIGKGKCSWTETGQFTLTYRGLQEYFTYHVNITNKNPEETITLHGVHEYPFEFRLPEGLPSSYGGWLGSISYKIILKFVKPNFFSVNKVFTTDIPVYGFLELKTPTGEPISEGPVIFSKEKSLFSPFSFKKPVVSLKAEIAKTFMTPGENINLSYEVTNNANVAITAVRTDLFCYTTATAGSGKTNKVNKSVQHCETEMQGVPDKKMLNCVVNVPTLTKFYSVQNSLVISKEYRVRVTLRMPMPHRNLTVEMPVVIGQRKDNDENCHQATADEQPPSYWQVMREENEEKA